MNILVVGAGAIGGWLAGAFAQAGAETSLLARGKALEAIRADGLRIEDGDEKRSYAIAAAAHVADLPAPDAIVLTVKNYDFLAAVDAIAPAVKPGVAIVTAMNGLPWWFLRDVEGPLKDATLETIDPGARAAAILKETQAIGAVVHASTRVVAPGVIGVNQIDKLILGDAAAETSDITRELAQLMEAAGVPAPIAPDIRTQIWSKLWGNMSMNPVSALTRLSTAPIMADAALSHLLREMMSEFAAVGEAAGLRLPMTLDERFAQARKLGPFRTSMLNDVEAGKRIEIEALVGVVIEMADRMGLAIPTTRTVYALARGLNLRAA